MESQDKDRVAYYAAITIFFSSLELFIPKVLPFFRLGIANIPILLALDLPLPSFILLLVLKGVGNSYISGNLFSIFALVSIAQTLASGFVMFGAKRLFKTHITNYGLSMLGAIVSTYVQMALASLYIGKAISKLLPIMLTMSLISSIFVAYISHHIELNKTPKLMWKEQSKSSPVVIATLVLSAISAIMIDSITFALIAFVLALILQHIAGRKIKLIPHLFIMFAMVLSSILTPKGRVLVSFWIFNITELALVSGVVKALTLSTTIALSQAYSQILIPGQGIIGKTLAYFTALLSSFRENDNKNLLSRTKETLSLDVLSEKKREKKRIHSSTLLVFSLTLFSLLILSRLF